MQTEKIKQSIYSLALLFLVTLEMHSQQYNCNCFENLNKLIAKTEENYAGFPSKVNETTKPIYKNLIASLEKRTSSVTNPETCYYLLEEYVKYFRDKHFILAFLGNKNHESEIISLSEKDFKSKFSELKSNPIEGIWINPENTIKIAVRQKSDKHYQAIILESKDANLPVGLLYYTFTKTNKGWIAKEFNSYLNTDIVVKQKGNLLQIWNQKMFGKIYPNTMSVQEQEELSTWKDNNNGLDFKKLSTKTAYLKIPTFKNNDDKIMQLVSQNDSIIKSCDNLIVDLTGNGGGSTGWISFLPYFMTNPIIQYNTFLRVTPDNVKSKLVDLEPFVVNPIPEEYKKYFPDEILAAYKKAYEELPKTKLEFYPIPGVTFPLDSVIKKPKKIALIVDDLCGSSTEYFFFISKQSKKTTTYGINTIGMMDYEGMSNSTQMPFEKFILTIPIVKSSWTDSKPIDKN